MNEGAQDGNGDGSGDRAGMGTEVETHRRTPDGNGDGPGTRKRCRKGSVGPVAANSNIVEINKEAGGEQKEL